MADNYPLVQPPEWQQNVPAGLAGMLYSQDRARYENRAGLQDMVMGAQTQATLRDLPVQSRKLAAETEATELGTQFTRATQPGKIDVTRAEQQTALGNQQLLQIQQRMALVDALSRVGGPAAIPQIGDAIKKAGIDPNDPFIAGLLNVRDPSEVPMRARQAREALSEQYSQAMDLQRLRGDQEKEVAHIRGRYGVRAAGEGARAKEHKSAYQLMLEADDPVAKTTQASSVIEAPNSTPAERKHALDVFAKNWPQAQIVLQKGAPMDLPGLPPRQSMPSPYGQQQPTGQGVVQWGRDAQGNPVRLNAGQGATPLSQSQPTPVARPTPTPTSRPQPRTQPQTGKVTIGGREYDLDAEAQDSQLRMMGTTLRGGIDPVIATGMYIKYWNRVKELKQ